MKDGVVDRQNLTRACNEEVYSTLVGDVAYVPRSAKLERRVVERARQVARDGRHAVNKARREKALKSDLHLASGSE